MKRSVEQSLKLGITAHREGKLQKAESLYRKVLLVHPEHPDANYNLGLLAVSVNKAQTALPFLKTALEANPKEVQYWLKYIDTLIKAKQFDQAKQVIQAGRKQRVVKENVDSLEAHLTQAQKPELTEQKQGKTRLKNQCLQEPSPPKDQINILLEHYNNKRFDEAEKLAASITLEFANHLFSWKVLASVLKQTGRVRESLVPLRQLVALSPQDAYAQYNLGNTLKELGILDEAVESYKKAISLKPDYAKAHCNLGSTLKKLGNLNQAEASYKQAIAFKPDYYNAQYNLGNTLKELGRLDEAVGSYKQAIALEPDCTYALYNLGIALQESGRLEEAAASYKQAIALKPDYAKAYNNLGITLVDIARLEEAEASYKKAIALHPEFAEALFNLSIVQSYMDKFEEEIDSLKSVMSLDAYAYGLKAGVNLAICKFIEGDFEASKKYLLASASIQEKASTEFQTEKVYRQYLLRILSWHENNPYSTCNRKPEKTLYVIGESHSLVSHQLRVQSSDSIMLCKAKLIKGCKQWHLGNHYNNQYKKQFESIFYSLPESSEVMLTIGEIDCRIDSGIIKYRNSHPEKELQDIIQTTIDNFLTYIDKHNSRLKHNICIQGVPSPNINTVNQTDKVVAGLVDVIELFNFELKNKSIKKGFGFLDVHELTDRGDGLSNATWHIDDFHLSPDGFLEAWRKHSP